MKIYIYIYKYFIFSIKRQNNTMLFIFKILVKKKYFKIKPSSV